MRIGKEVLILNVDDVLPNRFQPRIAFDEKAIMELTESIKEHGVIQPIVVRRIADKYEIIAGERRYKASVLAGKSTIPAILADLNDKDSAEVALIENIQRQNLTPIEEAVSYKKILDMGYLNQVDLANKLGKTQSTIANKLRLLNLCDEVQDALLKEKISERHARSLLKLNEEQQKIMLNRIIIERLTVRKTDEEIEIMLSEDSNESGEQKIIDRQDLSIEEKGEKNMNNDNNEINVVPVEKVENSIFPSFPTTNIEESQPINFGFNFVPNNEQIQTNINQYEMNNEQPINIENKMNDEFAIPQQVEEPEKITDFSTIFGNPTSSITNEVPVGQNNNFNNFFGNFNGDLLKKIDLDLQSNADPIDSKINFMDNFQNIESQTSPVNDFQNIESQTSPVNDFQNMEFQTNPVNDFQNMEFQTNPVNNFQNMEFKPYTMNNIQDMDSKINFPYEENQTVVGIENDFNNIINSESILEPQLDIPMQPVTPQIEQLNFENEITPIQSFSLDDEDQFKNLNPQILSTSQTPVQIITPAEMPELQPIMPEKTVEKLGTLNDMINRIRDVLDNIEQCGYKIDSDEMDLENSYQISITIQK